MRSADPPSPGRLQRSYRWRVVLFLASAVAILVLLDTLYRGLNTLTVLDRIEAERDQWQRPSEVIQALGLQRGDTVVDLGCGAGYFTLKLSAAVGPGGHVLGVDIRRLPLTFLRIRSLLRKQHNISLIHGDPDDPHVASGIARAVLISNTYHEFLQPRWILRRVFQMLRPGGRLVIVDREGGGGKEGHHVDVEAVAAEVGQSGFAPVFRQDQFLEDRDGELWWLLVAERP